MPIFNYLNIGLSGKQGLPINKVGKTGLGQLCFQFKEVIKCRILVEPALFFTPAVLPPNFTVSVNKTDN